MPPLRPLPDFWYPIARMLLVLKALLASTAPGAFSAISARVYVELRLCGALVRRYLVALARALDLPPPGPQRPPAPGRDRRPRPVRRSASGFAIGEPVKVARGSARNASSENMCVEWALALRRVDLLLAALRDPDPIAQRIARRLAQHAGPRLRDLPVPACVLRQVSPVFDMLLMRLDGLARPEAWDGLDPDSS